MKRLALSIGVLVLLSTLCVSFGCESISDCGLPEDPCTEYRCTGFTGSPGSCVLFDYVCPGCEEENGELIGPVCTNCEENPGDPNCREFDRYACTTEVCDSTLCTNAECVFSEGCFTSPVDCDDGDPCTSDFCDPQVGCTNEEIVCDDGDENTVDSCVGGECVFESAGCVRSHGAYKRLEARQALCNETSLDVSVEPQICGHPLTTC